MRYPALGLLALCLALLAAPAGAQVTTPASIRAWLFDSLRTAPTEQIARAIEDQIWRFWMKQAPDQEAADLMNKAVERIKAYDNAGAMEFLDKLVAHAPDWAEAWNQRATVLFYQEKYDESLADVEKTLALEPKHFGALAGKAVILMNQGRVELGQKALREAMVLDPWLKERGMLIPVKPGQKT